MKGLILCGGFARRLGSITKDIPKALLDVGGKSVLERQVELLRDAGVEAVFLASGHLHERLESEVGDNLAGVPIFYVREEEPLGTGGAIKNALSVMDSFPVVVFNGDILLDLELSDMLNSFSPEMDGLLLAVKVDDASSYGRLDIEESGRISAFVEKDPYYSGEGYINGGIYIFNSSILNYFPPKKKFSIEYDVFPNVKNLYAYKFDGEWIDIGTPERLQRARELYSRG